jgi:hypothetical protein
MAAGVSAVVLMTAAPVFAQEGPPPPPQVGTDEGHTRYDADACRQQRDNHAVAGAVVGGILGAIVGSQVSGHGARTEGSFVGGGLGALGGAAVGADSTRCDPNYPRDDGGYRQGYQDRGDGGYRAGDYAQGDEMRGSEEPAYDENAYNGHAYNERSGDAWSGDRRYEQRRDVTIDADGDDYAYDADGRTYPLTDTPPGPDGCTLAESEVYMPDGGMQKRFIHVCRDSTGRYQVVE